MFSFKNQQAVNTPSHQFGKCNNVALSGIVGARRKLYDLFKIFHTYWPEQPIPCPVTIITATTMQFALR